MDSCNIKVAIKARPLNHKELLDGRVYWKIESDSVIHVDPITENKNGDQFFFDRVYCSKSTNYDVFDEIVRPIIDRGVQGFNGTVFAYGQTASGKTYIMSGSRSNPGIIPLAINYMFDAMNSSTSREYLLRASYLEIYNEKVFDLLEVKKDKSQVKKIEIQKDGLHITPLKAVVCQNAQMVIDLMKTGEKNRSIGETNMNERSSRSHTIFRIILESRNIDDDCDGAYKQSVINLVDLAGSERSSQTQSSMERFKEGCKINSSLTTLGLVIQQLSECPDSPQHINFRDSKLTRILQTSLGGNSLTAIICTVTLAVEDQTNNTLSFASRAKKIKNSAKVNENVTDETLLKRYRVQLSKLHKELEGIKQNQYENDEVNEIKYKYQVEKRTNEELKERIMRLQNNMITSEGNKSQPLNKKGCNRRRTWGGKLDNTFSSNSILETIEEDVNMPRPSVPSNFGNQNKDFKTPLEPFEWDLIREEDRTVDMESTNNDNAECNISPPPSMPFNVNVSETPKKVLRERVNNYKNMFELSMKENNELREFTTLEKQMFYENNEQLKDLSNLRKHVDDLLVEKHESVKEIEKLKCSIQLIQNEKRDVEVTMFMQKEKYEKRETELLAIIQETREELNFKEDQLKKAMSNDMFMAEKQEEIKILEMKIKDMNQLNFKYINEIEILKSKLLSKDQQLNEESSKHCSLLNAFSNLQNHVAEIKSVPSAIQFLANEGYFTLRNDKVKELDQLLEHIHNTVEQLQQENQNLIDENNNLKLITNDVDNQINNIKIENNALRSQLIVIEDTIKSTVKDFSASSEIDVDNSDINSLIQFAVTYFEQNTNEINKLSCKNTILKEDLSLSNIKLCEIKSFISDNFDNILQSISIIDIKSNIEIEKLKNELSETIEQNIFLKSSIETFNMLTFDCVKLVEQVKTNQSNIIHLQEDLIVCNTVKNSFREQINELNELNADLKSLIENQAKFEKEIREELDTKTIELNDAVIMLNGIQLAMKEDKFKTDSNTDIINELNMELQAVRSDLEVKSNLIVELEKTKLNLLTKFDDLEKSHQSNAKNIERLEEMEKQLQEELDLKSNVLDELKETKVKMESDGSEMEKLHTLLDSIKTELNEKKNEFDQLNKINSELEIKLEEKIVSENKICEELLTKTTELDNAHSQINVFQLTIEEMKLKADSNYIIINELNIELDTIKLELEEKKLIEEFENNKLDAIKYNSSKEIEELNEIIITHRFELEEKTYEKDVLKNELQIITLELEDTIIKVNEVKYLIGILNNKNESNIQIIEQLTNELEYVKSTLNEKIDLIVELENNNLELLTKCNNSEINDHLNKIIVNLETKLEDKIKIESEIRKELQAKSIQLEDALVKENEVQTLVESMENEIKSNIFTIEQFKSELATKSNLLVELNTTNSELLLKYTEINQTKLHQIKIIEDQLEAVLQEKTIIQTDLNLMNQKYLDMTKYYYNTNKYLEDTLQLQVFNYQKLYNEFVNLSWDIELLLKSQMDTESNLREEIQFKSAELDDLQKLTQESSLQQDYDKLEEEYMLRSRSWEAAQEKIVHLESILSTKEESEKALRSNLKSKCIALEEYKKNVEFLFSRNDSFQVRVNDFEENVLVDLNEEFDSMKSELTRKTEFEKTLLEENEKLKFNLNELQEKLDNATKELELSEERSEDLASIINVLIIEIKDANSFKESLESRLNEAEHEILKAADHTENLERELFNVHRELEIACINAECVEKQFHNLESKYNDKIDSEGFDVRNQLIDPLVDYVHDIKLKLTELNSAMISGNQTEKQFRRKVMSTEDDILPLDETWKLSSNSHPVSPDNGIDLEIDNLRKVIDHKMDLMNKLQIANDDAVKNINELQDQVKNVSNENNTLVNNLTLMENDLKEKTLLVNNLNDELNQVKQQYTKLEEHNQAIEKQINEIDLETLQNVKDDAVKNINELQDQIKNLSNDNNTLVNKLTLMENDLKEKTLLVNNLNNELNQFRKQYTELQDHNQAIKEQIHHSFDIDSELRNGKKNIVNEINLLEPGKITGVLTHHNLSNLLDTFVSLIMTKEQQLINDLVNDHNKNKQIYEDQIKQYQEDIKKEKEWQEQVESDNEKLCNELEILKSQKHNFPCKEIEIKELMEKVLDAENQSFNYLSELQELKTQFSKTSKQNYLALSNEFEVFKNSSEKAIQDLKTKLEDLTNKYNETRSMYTDQKNSRSTLEGLIKKIQSECDYLKGIIEKKDEDIKNLFDKVQLKTKDYETLVEKIGQQREEMKDMHRKEFDELQLELNEKTQKIYCTEKLLKEVTKNYNQLVEENASNPLNIKLDQTHDNSTAYARIAELEHDIIKNTEINEQNLESLKTKLKEKSKQLENTESQCSKLVRELEVYKLKIITIEKNLESCYHSLKLKDDQIENYQIKLKSNDHDLIEVNIVTEKLRNILKCTDTLPIIYENISSFITKCEHLENEIKELKLINTNLDNECEEMLIEIKNKDDKLIECLTQTDELKQNIGLLTEERNFLKNRCEQFKNINVDIKKLNDEICGYEQNIYQLRKEKGQLIIQHDKELTKLKTELKDVHTKNLELLNDYNKLSETAKNLEISLKEDIQQLNRCIVDKNAKISTLELFSKTNNDELRKKNLELEHFFKKCRDENHMLRKDLRRLKEITHIKKTDQFTQTVEEQSVVNSAIMADQKITAEKILKMENDNHVMKKILHMRKLKIEELQKQIAERSNRS